MSIGIIGTGALGSNIARALAGAGISAVISNRRGPDSLKGLVDELGPSIAAGTTAEAARADIVILSVRWNDLPGVVAPLGPWAGRIVIDATNPVAWIEPDSPDANDPTNPLAAYGIKPVDLGGRHSSSLVRELVPGARLVKAFNHVEAAALSQPSTGGGRRVLFYSGDDADAKASVRLLIERAGFWPLDLGGLDIGGPLASLPFGALATVKLVTN